MSTGDGKLNVNRTVGWGFMLIGAVIAMAGMIWLIRIALFVQRANRVTGTVVEMQSSQSRRGTVIYHPVYTFEDAAHVTHTRRSGTGSPTYAFQQGQQVTVLYDPNAPGHSEIQAFRTLWLAPVAVSGFGFLFGGVGCLAIFLEKRKGRNAQESKPITPSRAS